MLLVRGLRMMMMMTRMMMSKLSGGFALDWNDAMKPVCYLCREMMFEQS